MERKKIVYLAALLFVCTMLLPLTADASWKKQDGKFYYYGADGVLYKNKKVGKYYVGKDGSRYINRWHGNDFYGEDGKRIPNFKGGWQTIRGKKYYLGDDGALRLKWQEVDGYYYYFSTGKKQYGAALKGWQRLNKKDFYLSEKNGRLRLGWFQVGTKKYYATTGEGIYTGLRDVEEQTYLFSSKGCLLKGWRTYKGNKYYCTKSTGAIAKGLGSIGGKLYYFDEFGVMQTSKVVTIDDVAYSISSSGVCTRVASSSSTPEDMIFFTLYESGIEGYGQVGGDSGNACGKYQFDRRYSLIPFVKYCYEKDPVIFSAFAPYAKWSNTSKYHEKMKGNKKFYQAWTSIYQAYPLVFKNYQDAFAMQEYYLPVEEQLKAWGIDLAFRPYVVKGAVFSYSIQHGAYSAALAVRDAKIKNSTKDEDFLKKLYKHRINVFPTYKSRYTREMNDALSRL